MFNSESINRCLQTERLVASVMRTVEPVLAGARIANHFALAEEQYRIHCELQFRRAAALVCDDGAPIQHRLQALEDLIERWNPYPFDRVAQGALRAAGAKGRAEVRQDLRLTVLDAAAEAARTPQTWRFGRRWLKDASSRRAFVTLPDLEIDDFMRALRTLFINSYERLALDRVPLFNAREIRDSDQYGTVLSTSNEADQLSFEELGDRLSELSPHERQLFDLIARGESRASAARLMHVKPSTVRVLLLRIRKKEPSRCKRL